MKTNLSLFILVLFGNIASPQGTFIYDQQATGAQIAGGNPMDSVLPLGQSFTPALSAIGFVEFQFLDLFGVGGTVYVNLVQNSITGNVLAATAPVSMPANFVGPTNFYFGANVPVQSGVQYFLRPVLQSGNTILRGDIYNYAGGAAIINGQPVATGFNFWFREGIIVPEPTPASFILIGSLALGYLTRPVRS